MTTTLDQKTYLLNKYLKAPSTGKKKKKRKHVKGTGLRIIDDDVDTSRMRPLESDELELLAGGGEAGEDAPQVAGVVDERPEHVRKMEQFQSGSKWRVIAQDDGFDSKIRVEEIKRSITQMSEVQDPIFGKMYSDSEDEKNNDSDLSPPRKTSVKPIPADNTDKSRNKQIHRNSDSDLSPPRIKSHKKPESVQSPKRRSEKTERSPHQKIVSPSTTKHRRNSDSDLSPPRKNESQKPKERPRKSSRWGHFGPEDNSKTQQKPNHHEGRSPPRKPKHADSPQRKSNKHSKSRYDNSDSDLSPPRKSKKCSPPRQKHGSDSDLSPPRKTRKKRDQSVDSNLSPPRMSRNNQNPKKRSPERTKSSSNFQANVSGDSKHNKEWSRDSDNRRGVPDRRSDRQTEGERGRERYRDKRNNDSPPPSNKKMAKTLEGKLAGLQDARQLQSENEEFRRREERLYSAMTADVSGRDAATVSRRLGKRDTSADKEMKREEQAKRKELEEKYNKWGKGLTQVAALQARAADDAHEASKPLARHRDDADLERALRERERAGDPMLEYARGKRKADDVPVMPTYKGNWPPNRFNIRPGYRWDGVDRSNGYEKKYFDHQSKAKALEVEAYKWSAEDL